MRSYQEFMERSLTTKEKSEKERIVKGMKKSKSSFKKNYKDDAESVMYATATKLAKEESCGKGEYYCREDKKCKPIPEGSKIDKDGTLVSEAKSAAWTRKAGKNKSGGLNEKGRKSYERENPGSDLKAPSKKVGNPRRASFCARMRGMKKKLTSKKTASDPDSRI